jgi:hypothetical protein
MNIINDQKKCMASLAVFKQLFRASPLFLYNY